MSTWFTNPYLIDFKTSQKIIYQEAIYHLIDKEKINKNQANNLINVVNKSFPNFIINDSKIKPYIQNYSKDPNDDHVVAVNKYCDYYLLITENIKDFKNIEGIFALTPDNFLTIFAENKPEAAIKGFNLALQNLTKNKPTQEEFLNDLYNIAELKQYSNIMNKILLS